MACHDVTWHLPYHHAHGHRMPRHGAMSECSRFYSNLLCKTRLYGTVMRFEVSRIENNYPNTPPSCTLMIATVSWSHGPCLPTHGNPHGHMVRLWSWYGMTCTAQRYRADCRNRAASRAREGTRSFPWTRHRAPELIGRALPGHCFVIRQSGCPDVCSFSVPYLNAL